LAEVSFGEWLKRRRKAAGLTQEQLAQLISCSTSALKKIEAEDRRPSAQIVERLAEVFNIPSNEQTNFLRFARGNWSLAPADILEEAPWHVSINPSRSSLPATTSALVGREKELEEVRAYLQRRDIRLVNLMGPPGIGKTRLSIELARESLTDFPDGVFFVALAPLEHPALIATTMVQTLDYTEAENRSAQQQLMDGIVEKQMLIVLDNCEHLIQEVAELVSELLSACPHLKILTTSREALRIAGEWLYSVPTLEVLKESASVDMETASTLPSLILFAERARAVRSDFVLNRDNIQAVASICAHLDGLPLAIELIAARIRLMSPQTLLAKLSDQFILYADGMRGLPARQKSLHNAINWSYSLLPAEEQDLFVRLSVFSGGFTLEADESIFSRTVTNKSVSDLIALLLDKSLLQRTLNERGEPRFSMLVTIQQFALNHLRERSEETEVRNWHQAYFLDLAEQADKEIHGPIQVEWMDRLEVEHDNLRAALDWGISTQQTELSLRLFNALCWPWLVRTHFSEIRSWFEKVRSLPNISAYPALYARLLNFIGRMNWLLGHDREAQFFLNESQAIWLKLGPTGERGLAEALTFLGMVALSGKEGLNAAQSFFERSLELYERHADQWGIAFDLFHLGRLAIGQNKDTSAFALLEKSMTLFEQLGDVWGKARVSQYLGELFLRQGKFERAHFYFDQHLRFDEKVDFKNGMTTALRNMGDLYRYQDEHEQATRLAKESLRLSQEHGLRMDAAAAWYSLGLIALHQEDYPSALQDFMNYFHALQSMNNKIDTCRLLIALAAVAGGTDQAERCAQLYGAAQVLFDTTNYRLRPIDQTEFDRLIQRAREHLGNDKFEHLANEGRAMKMEQAIAYALEEQE
jgi:predicted ATPase/DNA-binding XRE family transcriptional regulator